jgi:hypothetical protein
MYVIKRGNEYVAPAGSHKSYTKKLENARTFPTRAAAEADACGNESVHAVSDLVGRG